MKFLQFVKIACAGAVFCMVAAAFSQAQQSYLRISATRLNGAFPLAPVVQGQNGNLYGTIDESTGSGYGQVFAVTPAGAAKTLYLFCSVNTSCPDGADIRSGLTLDSDGTFYGVSYGGSSFVCSYDGDGAVFSIKPDGTFTDIYHFCTQPGGTDGYEPGASLVRGENGNFYGTTIHGGLHGGGTIFEITAAGALTTLYNFCTHETQKGVCLDGENPSQALLLASNGNFYGVTPAGGANNGGTIFEFTPSGKLTILYSFGLNQFGSGAAPNGLIQATDGNLYGTTNNGGTAGYGTVFSIDSTGAFTTLYTFCSQTNCLDGFEPMAPLIQASDGNFYGTTAFGGTGGEGTIFKMTPSGSPAVLYNFCSVAGCMDGRWPSAPLFEATNGVLYGTTQFGAQRDYGTIFGFSAGLAPVVEPNPVAGKVGSTIGILGNHLTGASSVTFNGVPAVFTVLSDTYIRTTVPTGATTGTIEVVTAGGALLSNPAFRVLD